MKIRIRKFDKGDIPNKVKWINDPKNNTFLHYDLPLEIEKTEIWFEKNKERNDRYDAIVEVDGIPVGLVGLLSIDQKNKKAEYYITIGEGEYLGKGIAQGATKLLLHYAFDTVGLNRVYLYTEIENCAAVKAYERIGFKREGLLKNDLFSRGRFVDRYIYGITKKDFYHYMDTPVHLIGTINKNNIYVKREDLLPFSFGGNKARKARLFFEEIDRGEYDCVVTYGSSSSNHCRVVANMAIARNLPCYIISPEEASAKTYNREMMASFGAEITMCPVDEVHDTIEEKIESLKSAGRTPYFIAGGGHGNLGTQAYVDCYEEIRRFELEENVLFDYVFLASGTGTTQAGLICGQLINRDDRKIIGISIARRAQRGRDIIKQSTKEYLEQHRVQVLDSIIEDALYFDDDYVGAGYGSRSHKVDSMIQSIMAQYGVPLDPTYTGKAFAGMVDYIGKESLTGRNVLFIHTGGTPLFFDGLRGATNEV